MGLKMDEKNSSLHTKALKFDHPLAIFWPQLLRHLEIDSKSLDNIGIF